MPRITLEIVFRFLQFRFHTHQLLRKPLRGLLRCLPSCFQALIYIVRGKGVDNARGKLRIARVKSNGDEAAAVDGIDGQLILKSFQDPLRELPIATRGDRTDCESLCRGRLFRLWPNLPPPGGVEFGKSVETELFNDAARQAFTGQDVVLRPQVCVGDGLELIELLDGRNVRVLLLNFEQYLSAIDGPLPERHDKNCRKQDEKDDQDCRQALVQNAAISAKVKPLVRL